MPSMRQMCGLSHSSYAMGRRGLYQANARVANFPAMASRPYRVGFPGATQDGFLVRDYTSPALESAIEDVRGAGRPGSKGSPALVPVAEETGALAEAAESGKISDRPRAADASGYLDGQGLVMLTGPCWTAHRGGDEVPRGSGQAFLPPESP
jgi:hypothetical protein